MQQIPFNINDHDIDEEHYPLVLLILHDFNFDNSDHQNARETCKLIFSLKTKFAEKQNSIKRFRLNMYQNLDYIPIEYYDNLEFAHLFIEYHSAKYLKTTALSGFSDSVLDNLRFQWKLLRKDPSLLLTRPSMMKNREMILYAISKPGFGHLLEKLGNEFRFDKELKTIAEQNGLITEDYMLMCEAWKEMDINEPEERRIVKKILSRNGDYFEVLPHMHGDRELALIAIKDDPSAIHFVSEELKRDKDFILEAIKSRVGKGLKQMEKPPEYWRNDRQVLLEIAKQNYNMLQYSDYDWKQDDEFVIEMIRAKTIILQDIPERFKTERIHVMELVKYCGMALRLLSQEMKNDREIVIKAIKDLPTAYQFASEMLKNDLEIIKTALGLSCIVYHMIPSIFRKETEIVLIALKSGLDFKQIPSEMKSDRDFILQVCEMGKISFYSIPLGLVSDLEILGTFIKNMDGNLFKYEDLPEDIRNSRKDLFKLIELASPSVIALPMEFQNDNEFILECIRLNGEFLAHLDYSITDSTFIEQAVQVNWRAVAKHFNHLYRAPNFKSELTTSLSMKQGIFYYAQFYGSLDRKYLKKLRMRYAYPDLERYELF